MAVVPDIDPEERIIHAYPIREILPEEFARPETAPAIYSTDEIMARFSEEEARQLREMAKEPARKLVEELFRPALEHRLRGYVTPSSKKPENAQGE
jgi:hypothetical protein